MTDSQWGLFATTVGTFLVTEWRAARARQWAKEDRLAATAEIVATAKAEAEALAIRTEIANAVLKRDAIQVAAQVREEARITAAEITDHITDAKDAAHASFQEANHVNLKIEDTNLALKNLNERLLKQGEKQDGLATETAKVIHNIDAHGGDTNARVRNIEKSTT